MLNDFLKGLFAHFGTVDANENPTLGSCQLDLNELVEQVVDQVSKRLRSIPRYNDKLHTPVATSLRHIDRLAETVPGPLLCSRAAFSDQPIVNAFFVNPHHVQEVFSQSQDVRNLFDTNPLARECWGLLCVHMQERQELGMALVEGQLRKEVMQTTVSFSDHQIVSPGTDEASARCALKCCMFHGLLAHIRRTSTNARNRVAELERRLQMRKRQLKDRQEDHPEDTQSANQIATEIAKFETELADADLRLDTIGDLFDYVVETLRNPQAFIESTYTSIRLNRLGKKLPKDSAESGFDLHLVEIRIASQRPRIGTLVRFPREELLPRVDFLKQASLFLAREPAHTNS